MKIRVFLSLIILLGVACQSQPSEKEGYASQEIKRVDRPEASILKGVFVPADKDIFYTSGLVGDVLNPKASEGDFSKYGNTYQQSIGALKKITEVLEAEGYKLKDVIFLRVYLAPNETGEIDWDAWFKAYGEFFNNESNPNKVARSTIGVYKLARPELLVEVEAVAAH